MFSSFFLLFHSFIFLSYPLYLLFSFSIFLPSFHSLSFFSLFPFPVLTSFTFTLFSHNVLALNIFKKFSFHSAFTLFFSLHFPSPFSLLMPSILSSTILCQFFLFYFHFSFSRLSQFFICFCRFFFHCFCSLISTVLSIFFFILYTCPPFFTFYPFLFPFIIFPFSLLCFTFHSNSIASVVFVVFFYPFPLFQYSSPLFNFCCHLSFTFCY